MRGLAQLGWTIGCVGLAACGDSIGNEFDALVHGTIQVTVRGTGGQPLEAVRVALVVPEELSEQFAFSSPSGDTDSNGRFSLPVEILASQDADSLLPEVIEVYARATAHPPRYPAASGEESTTDSVLVAVQMVPQDAPPPVTEIDIELPFPE